MKFNILLIILIGISAIIFVFSFSFVYDYFVYEIPIKSFAVVENYTHIETIAFDLKNSGLIIKLITHNDDDSLLVKYKDELKTRDFVMGELNYQDVYFVNQTIHVSCHESENHTYISYFKYLNYTVVDATEHLFISHKDGHTQSFMPCDYPKIIQYTKNLP